LAVGELFIDGRRLGSTARLAAGRTDARQRRRGMLVIWLLPVRAGRAKRGQREKRERVTRRAQRRFERRER